MRHAETVSSFVDIDLNGRLAVLCDLDGCLISGRHIHRGARDFVDACGDRLWIVSNNSSDTSSTLADRLAELDLHIAPQRILLAGEQTVRRLAQDARRHAVAIYADAPLRILAQELGIAADPSAPEIVVLGRDRRFSLDMAEELAAHIVDGAEFWATNLDRHHPAASGHPVPETGALVAALEACAGPFRIRSIGKPAADLIEIALSLSGAERSQALFVGDNVATDGEAARAAGIDFVRILHPAASPVARGQYALKGRRGGIAC